MDDVQPVVAFFKMIYIDINCFPRQAFYLPFPASYLFLRHGVEISLFYESKGSGQASQGVMTVITNAITDITARVYYWDLLR